MKRVFLLAIILTLSLMPCLAQKSESLLSKDKAQIVKAVLLDNYLLPKPTLLGERKELVYLSTENIPSKFTPNIYGISFILLSPKQIKEKANTIFKYYAFGEFKDDGSKVSVSFSRIYQDTRIPCSGCAGSASSTKGIRYEFRKINQQWQGKKIDGYSSAS